MARLDRLVDPADAWGADQNASSYERGRPSYPPAAVEHLARVLNIGPGRTVVDLGAGTGKFTRLLLATGATVVAVEPQAAMRAELSAASAASSSSSVEVLDGGAESIPLPDASVDVVCAATAFHWFDHEVAMPEIARVLRDGGGLGLIWNERDERVPWVREMTEIIRWDGYRPYGVTFDWRPFIGLGGFFTYDGRLQLPYAQLLDRASFVDRVSSISYISTLSPEARAPVLARCAELVAGFDEPFELPYQCDVIWASRVERAAPAGAPNTLSI
ncbi:MAG: class I SAM-dependent methyltransferase [Acidimicrobiales bacterium]